MYNKGRGKWPEKEEEEEKEEDMDAHEILSCRGGSRCNVLETRRTTLVITVR
jgi:hypothetical protein